MKRVYLGKPNRRLITVIQWEIVLAKIRGERIGKCGWISEIFRRGNGDGWGLIELMRE